MRLNRIEILALGALLICGSGAKAATAWTPLDSANATNFAWNAHGFLNSNLRDYPSTRFQNVSAHYTTESGGRYYMLCGEMNTKNGFGGYGGWVQFGLGRDAQGATQLWIGDDPAALATIQKVCHGAYEGRVDDTRYDYSRDLLESFRVAE